MNKFNITIAILVTLLITLGGYYERGSLGGAEVLIIIAGGFIGLGLWKEGKKQNRYCKRKAG